MNRPQPAKPSWDDVADQARHLATLIAADFSPSRIVALARGGWFPALMLSHELSIKQLESVRIGYIDDAREELAVLGPLPVLRTSDRVLLVEDFLLTGRSLLRGVELLEQAGVTVRTAALGHCATTSPPDFVLGARPDAPTYPWERVRSPARPSA